MIRKELFLLYLCVLNIPYLHLIEKKQKIEMISGAKIVLILSILCDFFDSTKLFSDLYLDKFLDIQEKSFFPSIDDSDILDKRKVNQSYGSNGRIVQM